MNNEYESVFMNTA